MPDSTSPENLPAVVHERTGYAFRFREGDILRLPQGKNIQRLLIEKVWPSGSAEFQPVGKNWKPLQSRWGTYLGWSGMLDARQYDCAIVEGNIAQKQNNQLFGAAAAPEQGRVKQPGQP